MRSRSLRGGVTLAAVGVLTLTTIVLIGVSIAVIFTNYRGLLKDDLRRQSQHILEEAAGTDGGVDALRTLIAQEPFSTRFVTLVVDSSGALVARSSGPEDILSATQEDQASLFGITPAEHPVELTSGDSRLMVFAANIPGEAQLRTVVVGSTDSLQEDAARISVILGALGFLVIVVGSTLLVITLSRAVRPITDVAAATGLIDANVADRVAVPTSPTEAHQIAREINSLLERVEHDQLERKQLLATISHEMRTPLAIAQGQLEALERYGTDDEEVRGVAAAAGRELRRVSTLVDSALTLARAAAPGFISRRHVSLPDFADDLALRLSALDAQVVVHAPPRIDVSLDPERLAQAVLNLVMNAVTHNPEGVRVDVRWQADASTWSVRVEDDGIGLPQMPPDELIKPFVSGRPGSSGLGLAVTQSVVDAHGGTLTLTSAANSGATVTLSFPREDLSTLQN